MRSRVLGLAAVLAAVGCGKGDALVLVTVSSNTPLTAVGKLEGPATAHMHSGDVTVKLPSPISISDSATTMFAIQVPSALTGDFALSLTAYDAMNVKLDEGSKTTTTSPGSTATLALVLGVNAAPGDGGMNDGFGDGGPSDGGPGDAGGCPTTCDEAGVGCGMATLCGGMTMQCGACQLTAVYPAIAHAGDTIHLEGRFSSGTMIGFSGVVAGTVVQAIGASRAKVVVPAGAITGPISIMGSFGGGVELKVVSYQLGLGAFAPDYPQTDAARPMPQFVVDRSFHAVLTLGHVVLAIGGLPNMGNTTGVPPLTSIETANTNADGTLQGFQNNSGRTLVQGRAGMTIMRTTNSVYAIGGFDNGSGTAAVAYDSVESAQINGDGTGIQSFTMVSPGTSKLTTARYLAGSKIIGQYLYVFGGFTSGGSIFDQTQLATASIERAPILPNGTLGQFALVTSTLQQARGGHAVEVIGNTVYVLGGLLGDSSVTTNIEKATILGDGDLGTFSNATATLDTGRAVFASMVLGDKLYLIGGVAVVAGHTGPDNVPDVVVSTIDPATGSLGTFTASANGALTRGRAAFGQPAIIGNQLYVLGGGGGGGGGGPDMGIGSPSVSDVEQASINASGAIGPFGNYALSLSGPRTVPGSVVVGNHIYLFGGRTGGPLNTIDSAAIAPDGTILQFSRLSATLTTARDGPGIAVNNGAIFVFGGGGSVTGEVFQVNMDGSLSTSQPAPVTLTIARRSFQMIVAGDYLYAIGGDGSITTAGSMERAPLDPVTKTFTGSFAATAATMNTAHSDCSGALIGTNYYLLGEINASSAVTDLSVLDTSGALTNFVTASSGILPQSRWLSTAAVVGTHLLLLGGDYYSIPPSSGLDNIMTVDSVPIVGTPTGPVLGTNFAPLPSVSLAIGRNGPVSTAVGNYVYVMGGYKDSGTGSGDQSSIERAQLK